MSDYDSDLLIWSEHQAELLRRMGAGEHVNNQIDWDNVAEEIASLGRSDKRELRSRIRTILTHLIKLRISPATDPRAGWQATILRERAELRDLMRQSPSLRPSLPDVVREEVTEARQLAAADLAAYGERPRPDPGDPDFSADQVLGPWMPD